MPSGKDIVEAQVGWLLHFDVVSAQFEDLAQVTGIPYKEPKGVVDVPAHPWAANDHLALPVATQPDFTRQGAENLFPLFVFRYGIVDDLIRVQRLVDIGALRLGERGISQGGIQMGGEINNAPGLGGSAAAPEYGENAAERETAHDFSLAPNGLARTYQRQAGHISATTRIQMA